MAERREGGGAAGGRRVSILEGLTLGITLIASICAWKLVSSTYRADIGTLCNGEELSGVPIRRDMAGVTERIRDRLRTPEGHRFFSTLRDLPILDRADRLRSEATRVYVRSCPMADTYERLAAEERYRSEIQRLCSYATFPGLAELDDAVRIGSLEAWVAEEASTDRMRQLGATLRYATTSAEAAKALRDAAGEIDVFTCDTAKVLERGLVCAKGGK